ncbi:Cna B-type domain-containing protein [Bifidobacterium adolescentis]|uniref:Cna B-type domain-containing protein n=1 Tax=Bifidobacterium adolescentis TaxID=1680 RepID=UPI003CE5B5DB
MTSQNERAEMNNRTATHRIITALCCAVALVFTTIGLSAPAAMAADSTTDTSAAANANGSITVTYQYQDAALNLASTSLYYLADWSAKGGYTPTGDFANHTAYPVDWDILNADQQTLRDFANTMAGYIAVNKPAAENTLKTDSAGVATFNQLKDGLYLAVVAPYQGNVLTCQTAAMLVALPNVHKDAADQRTLSIEPKADCAVPPTTTISVNKVWKDKNSSKRPESVTMNLLQDGKVYDSIMLNNANDWKYTWKGLQAKHEYTVVEANVPGNYTALVDRENNDYTVTNTAKPESAKTGASVAIIAVIVVVLAAAGIAITVVVRKKNTTENAATQTSPDDSE